MTERIPPSKSDLNKLYAETTRGDPGEITVTGKTDDEIVIPGQGEISEMIPGEVCAISAEFLFSAAVLGALGTTLLSVEVIDETGLTIGAKKAQTNTEGERLCIEMKRAPGHQVYALCYVDNVLTSEVSM